MASAVNSKFDDFFCSVFNLNNKNVNALIARELSGFTCARSLTMNSKFFSNTGPGSSPGQGTCAVFLGKTLNCHSLSTQVYKWVSVYLMLRLTLRYLQ